MNDNVNSDIHYTYVYNDDDDRNDDYLLPATTAVSWTGFFPGFLCCNAFVFGLMGWNGSMMLFFSIWYD